MPPTDKALAVMALTEKHLARMQRIVQDSDKLRDHFKGQRGTFDSERDYIREVRERAKLDHDLLRAVTGLVDHPERLAGEDEVVVKREEMRALRELLSMAERAAMACTETVMITENSERIRRAGNVIDRWLTSLPTI